MAETSGSGPGPPPVMGSKGRDCPLVESAAAETADARLNGIEDPPRGGQEGVYPPLSGFTAAQGSKGHEGPLVAPG
jgi:hypothetical protein